MSLTLDILIWVAVVVVAAAAAGELVPLAAGRRNARRPRGAHARPVPTEPAERRQAWHRVRLMLLAVSTFGAVSANGYRDHTTRWLAGIALFLIVAAEFRSWLGSSGPGGRRAAWPEFRFVLLAATGSASVLANGWRYDTLWWLAAVMLLILAPDIDAWLRARIISRASGDPTVDPTTGPPLT
jgi:hypothetical protein